MAVAVIVIAPVIVAALVNGNDIVGVIDAVNDTQPASEMGRQTGMLHFQKRDVYQRSIDMTTRQRSR